MRALFAIVLLLAACGEDRVPCDEASVYQLPITLSIPEDQQQFAEVETCYLPVAGPALCANGRLFDFLLRWRDPTLDGVLVLSSPFGDPDLRLTWRWNDDTWFEDGDRYSVKVTQGGQLLLDRTEPVTYADLDGSCEYEPEVAKLAF